MIAGDKPLDLNNCDAEPIHIPGNIQPHGICLRLSGPDLIMTHVSDNTNRMLGIRSDELLGKTLKEIVKEDQFSLLKERLTSADLSRYNPHRISIKKRMDLQEFDGIAHRFKDNLILELEPSQHRTGVEFASFYHQARESVQHLRSADDIHALYSIAVSEVKRITGFDRVLIYKFDENWNGHVLSEKRNDNIASYLDLHFPASDIPKQARDLYYLNRLRIIPTIDYLPSRLTPSAFDETGEPIDLSLSTLRGVSPIHLEYLRNMNVTGSMSLSITKNNKLWGLISCTHESGPLYVPFDVRAICDFLAETLSSLLPVHESGEDSSYRLKLATVEGALLHSMTQTDDFVSGLLVNPKKFLEIANATGGAIYYGGEFHILGDAPADQDLKKIVNWLSASDRESVLSTTSLFEHIPEATQFKDKACGLIAFSISKAQENYFLWFRPEVVQTVKWGGNPNKLIEGEDDSRRLHPRKSFDLWKETVRLTSLPWKEEEKEAVANLRASIIDIVLQRVEKITKLNVELERSNTELDSFAYAASHDLKEPLRGIHNYASVIIRQDKEQLSEDSGRRLDTIIRLTERAENLINSLLYYSQIGRTDLIIRNTDVNELVRNALEALKSRIDEENVKIIFDGSLPHIECDRVQMTEVFTNLISNAIKYNGSSPKIIEIGVDRNLESHHPIVFFIRDNGIGIDTLHHHSIFKIFKRLHAKDKFGGGAGTGLTIVKKIIEKHGGHIWIKSTVGEGTTFCFTVSEVVARAE